MTIYREQEVHNVEGMKACNGIIHRTMNTNFNMPIANLFTGSSSYANGWICAYLGCHDAQSRDLTAIGLKPGYEVAENLALYKYCVTGSDCINGSGNRCLCWKRGATCFAGYSSLICVNIDAGGGWAYQFWQQHDMTGIDVDEVCIDAMYCTRNSVVSVAGDSTAISVCAICMDWGNVPSVARCSGTLRGSIWVEGNTLRHINAQCWEHCINGICVNNVGAGNAGSMWIDLAHKIHWVGSTGNQYCACWQVCQFCSTFSNSSPANPAPGASFQGRIFQDCQFGRTHLSYIGCDGNKYLTGAGVNPYA